MELQCQGQRRSVVRQAYYCASEHLNSRDASAIGFLVVFMPYVSTGPRVPGRLALLGGKKKGEREKFIWNRIGLMASELMWIQHFLILLPGGCLWSTLPWSSCVWQVTWLAALLGLLVWFSFLNYSQTSTNFLARTFLQESIAHWKEPRLWSQTGFKFITYHALYSLLWGLKIAYGKWQT